MQVPMRILGIGDVVDVVSEFYHVSVADLWAKKRTGNVAWARQVAMTLCVELCAIGTAEVGRQFGNRDHGTVGYAIQHVANVCETDKRRAEELRQIKEALGVREP